MLYCFNATEVFRIATEIKDRCIAFYQKAQGVIQDSKVKELFESLVREETEHKLKIENMRARVPGGAWTPSVSDPEQELDLYIRMMAEEHLLSSVGDMDAQLAQVKTARDALKLALRLEKDSVIFFLGMQEATCEGQDRDLLALLIKEEQDHVRRLSLQARKS
ncbi:MAG: ferritin family protein [Syntrophobacteraceae bacterium]|jgi:rubrerythrin|nr:ferritin family protein [Syntrophobacteraceae bacterium]